MVSTAEPPATAQSEPVSSAPVGGAFLLGPIGREETLTPERLSSEHRAIRASVEAFVEREVKPRTERIEARDYAVHRELMERLGRDGFLGIDVPEQYGGAGLDKTTSVVVTE